MYLIKYLSIYLSILLWYVYYRACLSYISFSISQRSVTFLGIVHLPTTTFSFAEQKYYIINAKIATEIGLKTLFHNIAYNTSETN